MASEMNPCVGCGSTIRGADFVISPRFNVAGAGLPTEARPLHIHLHLPDRLTDVVMQFLATYSEGSGLQSTVTEPRPTLFDREDFIPTPGRGDAGPEAPAAAQHADSVSGDAESPESLLAVYQLRLKAKRQRGANADTVGSHETSMRAFDRFCSSRSETSYRCITPVRSLSDPDVLAAFSEFLIREDLSPCTINRALMHVAMLAKVLKIDVEKPTPSEVTRLREQVKAKKGKPAASAEPQLLTPLQQEAFSTIVETDRRIPSFAEIDAMARAVSVARYPYGDHAPYFWRGWIRFLSFIGCRSRDVVSTKPRKTGLRRQDVIFDTLCPIPDVNNALGYPLHSPHGWMWYVIGKDHLSESGCRRILFPMPQWMRDWARFFIEFSGDSTRIFPSTQSRSKSLTQDKMSESWNAIVSAAGVDPRLRPSEGSGDTIALRKFASNWWHLATLKAKNDLALAQKMSHYVLHHKEVTVSNQFYLSVQAVVLPVMLELLNSWPVPAADATHVSLLPE